MKAFTYDDILMVPSYNHWESRKVVDISMKCKMGQAGEEIKVKTYRGMASSEVQEDYHGGIAGCIRLGVKA